MNVLVARRASQERWSLGSLKLCCVWFSVAILLIAGFKLPHISKVVTSLLDHAPVLVLNSC